MLRCIDERGGIAIYARNIVEEILKIDAKNEYRLFFRGETHFHRYTGFPNAKAFLLQHSNNPFWDQVLIPRMIRQEKIDLIFNPKFTLPLSKGAKAVMTVHGADWFLPEYKRLYHPIDRAYIRIAMPLYVRRASAIISASNYCTQGFLEYLPGSKGKLTTIYYCAKGFFQPVTDPAILQSVRRKHNLPDAFIFTAIHYDTGRKNFANMLKAFRLARNQGIPHRFVVCGRDVEKYAHEARLQEDLGNDVVFKGWVEQEDLPAIYSSANLYLYPTRLEGFPIPITEAMACGCPIVTSKYGVFPEAAGDAALYVDPENPAEIAVAIGRILNNRTLSQSLKAKGIERSRKFTWDQCASQTLTLFESLK